VHSFAALAGSSLAATSTLSGGGGSLSLV
jgi:hypothetical protein